MAVNDVFEEWTIYAKKKQLIQRRINTDSIISNSKLKIPAITGIRRAGKSSLLMLIAQKLSNANKKVAYINLEDNRIKDKKNVLDEIIKWFGDEGFLLLDEITSIKSWDDWLSRTHELLKGKLRIIISSSRKGFMMPSKPLRGRIIQFEIYPLSFKEFLIFKDIKMEKTTSGRGKIEKALKEYLKYGGFPEITLTPEKTDKIRIFNSYFKDIIGLDIAEVSQEDISSVEIFGKYAIQSTYFSASKCLNFFKTLGYKIGKEKILSLERYSQESFLFFFIPIFSYKIKDISQYPRKSYMGDVGFAYSISGRIDMGRIFENTVFLELKRKLQGQKEIHYWKNKEGKEVDFIVKKGANIDEIIQVVYDMEDEKVKKREIDSLIKCAKELKLNKGMIITKNINNRKTIEKIKITFISLADWLLKNNK